MKSKLSFFVAITFFSSFSFSQALKINEIMASNTTYLSDLNNYGDWIEIYNPSNQEVDLAGYYVTDDYTLPTKYQIPSGDPSTVIAAGGYKLIWADDSARVLHTNFKLSGTSGERFALVNSDGTTFIDSISFGIQTSDVSYGRITDGSDSWTTFSIATPNASNADPTGIFLTEFNNVNNFVYPNPASSVLFFYTSKWEEIAITDFTGKLILKKINTSFETNQLDITPLPTGIYTFTISENGKTRNQRLIKL